MPITTLAPSVVVALGSSQVLTTPVSVVKELVDNALDAGARSIFVDISVNTLDCIQVTDDGLGIALEDRDHVAKRHCTSKITDLADLRMLGGKSLGFRGEALASAAEMAGRLEIVTRTDGESAATKLMVGEQGRVASRQSTSHAVGTTVRIHQFLQHLPVRKETSLKESGKNLLRIKEILQSYAITRPQLRFSLKILGAKNEKGHWSYAPRRNATIADAALAVAGKDTVAQCSMITKIIDKGCADALTGQIDEGGLGNVVNRPYKVEAFLPTAQADTSKISGKGQYVSIDSRPVSCARGTLKELITRYKRYIQSSLGRAGNATVKDPFLCLNVICSSGSYDQNVEPAKDDILFEDPKSFLDALDRCFIEIYGNLDHEDAVLKRTSKTRHAQTNAFELLLARRRSVSPVLGHLDQATLVSAQNTGKEQSSAPSKASPEVDEPGTELSLRTRGASVETNQIEADDLFVRDEADLPSKRTWRSNMYDDDDDDEQPLDNSVNSTGPSVFRIPERQATQGKSSGLSLDNFFTRSPRRPDPPTGEDIGPQSPVLTLSPHRPITPPFSTPHISSSSPGRFPISGPEDASVDDTEGSLAKPGTYTSTTLAPTRRDEPSQSLDVEAPVLVAGTSGGKLRMDGFVSARCLPLEGLPEPARANPRNRSNPNYERESRRERESGDFPVTNSVNERAGTWPSYGRPQRIKVAEGGRNRDIREVMASQSPERGVRNGDDFIESPATAERPHPDVEAALDYERRKQLASKSRRLMRAETLNASVRTNEDDDPVQRAPGRPSSGKSPHQSRYEAAVAALRPAPQTKLVEQSTSVMAESDPRRHLMRIRGSDVRRTRLSMLPLEAVPEKDRLQQLALTLSINMNRITKSHQAISSLDTYVDEGVPSTLAFLGLIEDDGAMTRLQRKTIDLFRLVDERDNTGNSTPLSLDLATSVRDHLRAFS